MRLLLFLALVACASKKQAVKLSPQAQKVTTRMPMFGSCKKLGKVEGEGPSILDVEIDAKNKAAKLGANYIDLDVPRGNPIGLHAQAVAYRCRY